MTRDLPPIEFVLTPKERDHTAWARVHLEHLRRERNERDSQQARRPA